MGKLSLFILLLSSIVWAKDIKVFEIDTGVDLSHKEIKSHVVKTNEIDYKDINGHGTHIAGIILKGTCKEVKLISCKYYYDFPEVPRKGLLDCFQEAIKEKVDYVNFSSGGKGQIQLEKEFLEILAKNGTVIVTAAGNDHQYDPEYYPAKYNIKGLIVVGNLKEDGTKNKSSNYGFRGMKWEIGTNVLSTFPNGDSGYMTGTSQATAKYTNSLLKARCLKLK